MANNPLTERLLAHLQDEHRAPTDQELKDWIEKYCWIIPKGDDGGSRRPTRLTFNEGQSWYWDRHTPRDFIVKFRQGGFSTLILAEGFARAVLQPNQHILILAHTKESTQYLFEIVRQYYDRLPDRIKRELNGVRGEPRVHNQNELYFAQNGSRIVAMTAGSRAGARGRTLTFVHLSETAYYREWAGDVIASLQGALVPGGMVRVETTPNIAGTWAYQTWQQCLESSEPPYQPVFVPWWIHGEYRGKAEGGQAPYTEEEAGGITQHGWTPEHIAWRRQMLRNMVNPLDFKTEYPEDPLSGWLRSGRTVFHMPYVLDSYGGLPPTEPDNQPGWREYVPPDPEQKYWIGVDPAEGVPGGDFSAIQIFDQHGEQVAEWADYVPIHQLAEMVKTIRYPAARVIIERNNHGHALLSYLQGAGLPLKQDKDKRFGLVSSHQAKAGWIARGTHGFWQHAFRLHSYRLFQQLTQYVYSDNDIAGGPDHGGDRVLAHDDLISAFLLAIFDLINPRDPSQRPFELQEISMRPPTRRKKPKTWTQTGEPYPDPDVPAWLGMAQGLSLPPSRCRVCGRGSDAGPLPATVALADLYSSDACPGCGRD